MFDLKIFFLLMRTTWKTFKIYGSILFAIESCTDSWYILRHNDGGVRSVIASWKNDVYRCVETTAVVLPEIDLEYEDDSWMHPRGNRLLGEKRIISIRLLMKKIPSLLNATLYNAAALCGKIERIQKRNSKKKILASFSSLVSVITRWKEYLLEKSMINWRISKTSRFAYYA